MKNLYLITAAAMLSANLIFGQAPSSFKYQAALRDASGSIKASTSASIDIAILQGSATGSVAYSESHSVTTNAYGLVNLDIGSKNTTGFAAIDWANGPFYVKITVDGTEWVQHSY